MAVKTYLVTTLNLPKSDVLEVLTKFDVKACEVSSFMHRYCVEVRLEQEKRFLATLQDSGIASRIVEGSVIQSPRRTYKK
jgi:hypothetical protein